MRRLIQSDDKRGARMGLQVAINISGGGGQNISYDIIQ